MILNKVLIWVIVVIFSLITVVIVYKLLNKKTFLSSNTSGYIAFVIFLIFILSFFLNTRTVYLIKSKTDNAAYYLIGSINYQFKDGNSKEIAGSFEYCIINDYDKKLELEALYYGTDYSSSKEYYPEISIEPYSVATIPSAVNYFLNETPPKSNKRQTNYWLHE